MFSRTDLASFYEAAHQKSGWSAAWGQALFGLTPEQAAWKPSPDRHTIWQIANHISFWREEVVRRMSGKGRAPDDLVERENWRAPGSVNASEWKAAQERFAASHAAMTNAARAETMPIEDILHMLGHDYYHVGQIMLLRAMQGLKPIE